MYDYQGKQTNDFTSFSKFEGEGRAQGMNDWAMPWSDLMMVMFVLFVVLFVYASSHQDVKVLFSRQSADSAQSTSTLDPLIGLIGNIASRADMQGSQDVVRMAENEVLFRSRTDGVSVIREGQDQVRVTMRGHLFFEAGSGELKPDAAQYLAKIAEVVKLSVGSVHVLGYAAQSEASGAESFTLSTNRATDVADVLISRFKIPPKRIIVTGRGAYMPEVPDTSDVSQERNRRVEIVISNTI